MSTIHKALIALGTCAAGALLALAVGGCSLDSIDCGPGNGPPGGEPVWAPNGRKVAFRKGIDIYVVKVDGTGLRRLTHGACLGYAYPSWSPDGKSLVVRDDDSESAAFAILDARTGRRRNGLPEAGFAPSWSPDGRWIATGNDAGMIIFRPQGGEWEELTDGSGYGPDWSPNGKLVVFDGFAGHEGLYLVSLTNRHPRKILDHGESPAWSPDGRRIAFQDTAVGQIGLIRPDGSSLPPAYRCGECELADPGWSPDGRELVFYEEGVGIRIVTPGSSRVRTLVALP